MNMSSMYEHSKISTVMNILFIIDPPRVNWPERIATGYSFLALWSRI